MCYLNLLELSTHDYLEGGTPQFVWLDFHFNQTGVINQNITSKQVIIAVTCSFAILGPLELASLPFASQLSSASHEMHHLKPVEPHSIDAPPGRRPGEGGFRGG